MLQIKIIALSQVHNYNVRVTLVTILSPLRPGLRLLI
jgi:hypothetical protein